MARITPVERNIKLLEGVIAVVEVFEKLVEEVVRAQGRIELKTIQEAFENSFYFGLSQGKWGMKIKVLQSSKNWRAKKLAKWNETRPGWANGVLGRTLGLEQVMQRLQGGYEFDVKKANPKTAHYYGIFTGTDFVTSATKTRGHIVNMQRGFAARHYKALQRRLEKEAEKLGTEVSRAVKTGIIRLQSDEGQRVLRAERLQRSKTRRAYYDRISAWA